MTDHNSINKDSASIASLLSKRINDFAEKMSDDKVTRMLQEEVGSVPFSNLLVSSLRQSQKNTTKIGRKTETERNWLIEVIPL